jgi:hypothetical protein
MRKTGRLTPAARRSVCYEISGYASGNALAYQWTAGQEFAYDVEIVVDDADAVVTYKGVTQHHVDSASAEQLIVHAFR